MATIQDYLNNILKAVYGKDVRQSIHDAIKQCYEDVTSPELNIGAFETAVQNKIDSGELAAMTLADKSVTSEKLADGAVNTDNISDGSITQEKLVPGIEIDVKDGGVTEEKIANYAVTAGKIEGAAFEQTGCNYINPKECIDGYCLNSSGEEVVNAGYRVSGKIYFEDQTYYSIDKLSWDGNSYIAFYDGEDACLSAVMFGHSNLRTNGELPAGTEYIRVSFPLVENTYPLLLMGTKSISTNAHFFKIPWVSEYVGNGAGKVSIGSEFTSLLKDIPIGSLKDANADYYNLFSGVQDESSGFYYLPIRSQYVIYATGGGWSNLDMQLNVAYKSGEVKTLHSTFVFAGEHTDPLLVDDIQEVAAVFVVNVRLSENALNGLMISTREDLTEYHPYGESYFNPSEQMKQLVQDAAQEDIIKNYGSGVLLGIGDSYMQNNTALAAIAAKHNLVCDNRGMASSSISGDEAQTIGLYPFWSRINTAVEEYTAGKTISDAVYHCEDVKLIVFMGGANDGWIDYRRGAGKTETDTNTIYGALNSCFSTLLCSFPNADIIVILQPVNYNVSSAGWDEEMAKGYGFESLAAAQKFSDYQLGQYAMHMKEAIVKEMAEMYGLNIVDCCFNWYSVLNPNDRAKYWNSDKLHMSSDGNDAIYNVALERAINNLKITRN